MSPLPNPSPRKLRRWVRDNPEPVSLRVQTLARNTVSLITGNPPVFPFCGIENRRFMYCARTRELILGRATTNGSHAEEHWDSRARGKYDEFVRGWVGFGGRYRHGVIHFAPPYTVSDVADPAVAESLLSTLIVFASNGASPRTILRGAGTAAWEASFGEAYPELLSSAPMHAGAAAIC